MDPSIKITIDCDAIMIIKLHYGTKKAFLIKLMKNMMLIIKNVLRIESVKSYLPFVDIIIKNVLRIESVKSYLPFVDINL